METLKNPEVRLLELLDTVGIHPVIEAGKIVAYETDRGEREEIV